MLEGKGHNIIQKPNKRKVMVEIKITRHNNVKAKSILLTSFESRRLIRDWSEGADLDIYKSEAKKKLTGI